MKEKGSIYVTEERDMGRLISILCNNGYKVKVTATSDMPFCDEYKITFKKGGEQDC